ncbi:hypothetical protein VP01_4199g1 [Puccinia sorghi]|uniref:Tc1-like transposase DDE domain-containing protein n=1 Tax=Puccinia sorghi TaxID=27349 RepID=A0A0L6URN0_9BASI|nr:hypothetical protein VP01_4199g1 [Puccinia sorghi]
MSQQFSWRKFASACTIMLASIASSLKWLIFPLSFLFSLVHPNLPSTIWNLHLLSDMMAFNPHTSLQSACRNCCTLFLGQSMECLWQNISQKQMLLSTASPDMLFWALFEVIISVLPPMNCYHTPNSVLVLDNARIHQGGKIENLCQDSGINNICQTQSITPTLFGRSRSLSMIFYLPPCYTSCTTILVMIALLFSQSQSLHVNRIFFYIFLFPLCYFIFIFKRGNEILFTNPCSHNNR